MTLLERVGVSPSIVAGERLCNDPSGCRRRTVAPDQARCERHRERWIPEWRRRAEETAAGLARDLTGIDVL